jgi:hypothetical protein
MVRKDIHRQNVDLLLYSLFFPSIHLVTNVTKKALSVLILCHHKDPGMKRPDV